MNRRDVRIALPSLIDHAEVAKDEFHETGPVCGELLILAERGDRVETC